MKQVFLCNNYEIDPESILSEIELVKPKKILIHAPDGLKHLYTCIKDFLVSLNSREIYYSASPGYGACDIPLEEAETIGADLIIHLGHDKYPLSEIMVEKHRVKYIPVFYRGTLDTTLLETLVKLLRESNAKFITLSSTLIDAYFKHDLKTELSNRGFTVHEVVKPILGCMYNHVVILDEKVDAHLVIAGGLFHPLGLALISTKPVIAVDPYMKKIWNATIEAEKIKKKRLFQIYRVKESASSRMGLIVGTRPGQYRPKLIEYIEREALSRGYIVYKITSGYLNLERLMAIDSGFNLDFYVVSSCPRLPIDDLANFHKPVLTPGEFLMLISNKEKYLYPW
ncbi:MAG: diphthamide biosynthesis enzyme Dph2 [Desulfurococcaceae archaeon]